MIRPLMIAPAALKGCSCPHWSAHFSLALAGLSPGCMGSIMDQSLWKHSTWLVRQNQLLTPMMSLGSGTQ